MNPDWDDAKVEKGSEAHETAMPQLLATMMHGYQP